MIHEEGWGCEHGFSSDLCDPQCIPGGSLYPVWPGGAGDHPWAFPPPAPPEGPGTGARDRPLICLGRRSRGIHFLAGLEMRGLTAAAPERLRQGPNSPAATWGALLRAPAASTPLPSLRTAPEGRLRAVPAGWDKTPPAQSPNSNPAPTPGPEPEPLRRPGPAPSRHSQSAAAAASGARAPCRSLSAMAEVSAEPLPGSRRAWGRSRPGGDTKSPEPRLPGAAQGRRPAATG